MKRAKVSQLGVLRIALLVSLILCIGLFLIAQKVISAHQVIGFTMSNDNWIIDFANLNMTSGKKSGGQYTLTDTVGQIAPGLYSGTNYEVRAGFQYVYSIIPFRFTISNLEIDFGSLTPTNPVTRTSTLTVSNGSANGYTVTAYENHALLIPGSGQMIPDTTCDSGTCNEITSSAWSSNLAYGFGYRCDNVIGTDCADGFAISTYYKQFANNSIGETAQPVMEGTNVGRTKEVTITYKVNISGTQPPGDYTNQIIYIAVPTF